MNRQELFKLIKKSDYEKTGLDVDYQICVVPEEKAIYLLFAGSNSDIDWKIDFNFAVKPYKRQMTCLRVHRGFVKAWKSANDEIIEKLRDIAVSNMGYEIFVCGWSYGGAMAILAGEDFYYRYGKKTRLITYGAPKILADKKSRDYVARCFKTVEQYGQHNDLVAHVATFYKHIKIKWCGDKFNLIKMLKNLKYYHCNYHKVEL